MIDMSDEVLSDKALCNKALKDIGTIKKAIPNSEISKVIKNKKDDGFIIVVKSK